MNDVHIHLRRCHRHDRQLFVVFIVFFSAKLTTIHSETGDDFLFPIPDWFRSIFLETGLLACILVVVLAQLIQIDLNLLHLSRVLYHGCLYLLQVAYLQGVLLQGLMAYKYLLRWVL